MKKISIISVLAVSILVAYASTSKEENSEEIIDYCNSSETKKKCKQLILIIFNCIYYPNNVI